MQQNVFPIKILDNFFSTVILKPSLHGFEFRFDRKFSNTHRSVSKGLWSLLKVVLRSQSRLQNVVLVFGSHVNFTTRIKASTRDRLFVCTLFCRQLKALQPEVHEVFARFFGECP